MQGNGRNEVAGAFRPTSQLIAPEAVAGRGFARQARRRVVGATQHGGGCRLIQKSAADKTLFTQCHTLLGTPAYERERVCSGVG